MKRIPWKLFGKTQYDEADRNQTLSAILDRNIYWGELADTKAGVILVFVTALVAGLTKPASAALRTITTHIEKAPSLGNVSELAMFALVLSLTFLGLLVSLVHSLLVVKSTLVPGKTHLFFGDVATKDYEGWRKVITSLSRDDINNDLIDQIYVTSLITRDKHKHIQSAIRGLMFALPAGIALFILSIQMS